MEHNELINNLRETVARQGRMLRLPSVAEDVRRQYTVLILQSIDSFLSAWEEEERSTDNFPNGTIRDAFLLLFEPLGPGDAQVRTFVLETLPSLKTLECRQILLDVLPWTVPVAASDLECVTNEILDVLQKILLKNSDSLLPILACLTNMPLSELGKTEARNLALASLSIVSESDLPVLVQTLLRHVTNEKEGAQALSSLRDELCLATGSRDLTDTLVSVANILISALQDDENGILLAKCYLGILERHAAHKAVTNDTASRSLFGLDLIAMLHLFQHPKFQGRVQCIIDKMLGSDAFPFDALNRLSVVLCPNSTTGEQAVMLQERLIQSFQALVVCLLLVPIRLSTVSSAVLGRIHEYVMELHHRLSRDRQEELVRCLLHLRTESFGVVSVNGGEGQRKEYGGGKSNVRSRERMEESAGGLQMTLDAVHGLLKALSVTSPASVSKFKYMLIEKLTSESNCSKADSQQVCEILVCLVEPLHSRGGRGAIDSTELMILLQKLLFTSSLQNHGYSGQQDTSDDRRAAVGLTLAIELVKSRSVSMNDKDCIQQWVHRIILPPNRRTVHPEVGSQGLQFLSIWSKGHEMDSASTFGDVKMVMANTGLVQLQAQFILRKRSTRGVLAYQNIPKFFVSSEPGEINGKVRKKRELVFCVNSYLNIRGVPEPARWLEEVQWVFTLVDTYLQMGREESASKKRSWTPDGWLLASIELPGVRNLVSSEITNKQTDELKEYLRYLSRYDISEREQGPLRALSLEISSSIVKMRTASEIQRAVDDLLKLSLSLCLSISVALVVLQHSLEDFQNHSEEEENAKTKAIRLFQYQLMKVFDLKRKLKAVAHLMSSIHVALKQTSSTRSKRRKLGSTKTVPRNGGDLRGDSNSSRRVEDGEISKLSKKLVTGFNQIGEALELLFGEDFIKNDWLSLCLARKEDDDMLVAALTNLNDSLTVGCGVQLLLDLKLEILSHWQCRRGSLRRDDSLIRGKDLDVFLATTSRISLRLSTYRKEADGSGNSELPLPQTISLLLALCLEILAHVIEASLSDAVSSRTKAFLGAFKSNFVTSVELGARLSTLPAPVSSKNLLQYAFDALASHLRSCDDQSVVYRLLECMSIFAVHSDDLVDKAVENTWRALHTVLINDRLVDTYQWKSPSVFFRAAQAFTLDQASSESKKQGTQSAVLLGSIVRFAMKSSKESEQHGYARNTLLLLWALMTHSSCTMRREHELLSKLVSEIESYLHSLVGRSYEQFEEEKKEPEERKPQLGASGISRTSKFVSSIPSLQGASYGVYFEMTVHMLVATFVTIPSAKKEEGDKRPFQQLFDMLDLFRRTVDLYKVSLHLLPRKYGSVMIGACNHILNATTYQVSRYVEWRNAEPIPTAEQKEAGIRDAGSIKYLEELLNGMAYSSCGVVASFCHFVRSLQSQQAIVGDKDTGPWLYENHQKQIRALVLATSKTMNFLRGIATSHNIVPPKAVWDEDAKESAIPMPSFSNRWVQEADKGFHELEWDREHSVGSAKEESADRKRRIQPTLLGPTFEFLDGGATGGRNNENEWKEESSEQHDDTGEDDVQSQESFESFGAAGDWGEDGEERLKLEGGLFSPSSSC